MRRLDDEKQQGAGNEYGERSAYYTWMLGLRVKDRQEGDKHPYVDYPLENSCGFQCEAEVED